MYNLHREESGQTALETAIILIAFIVVASVFAFTILSAGTASTERGEQAIAAGLEGVQSSMQTKGAIIAEGAADAVTDVIFTLSLVAGGDPVDLTSGATERTVVIDYRDADQRVTDLDFTVTFVGANDGDDLLEENEQAEITVTLPTLTPPLGASTEFTLEVRPAQGAVLSINRTTPAAIETIMELN